MDLARFLNQHSYAIAAAIALAWVGYEVIRRGATVRSLLVFAALALVVVLPPLWLRSGQHELVQLDAALASGHPTLLEVYSDL